MTKLRLLTYALGAAMVTAGLLIKGAEAFLVPAGTSLLGFATRWPQDTAPPPAPPPAA